MLTELLSSDNVTICSSIIYVVKLFFSFSVQPASGDLFLCSADGGRCCRAFTLMAVMRIPVVYCEEQKSSEQA